MRAVARVNAFLPASRDTACTYWARPRTRDGHEQWPLLSCHAVQCSAVHSCVDNASDTALLLCVSKCVLLCDLPVG